MTSFLQFVTYWWPSFLVILSCAWILLSESRQSTKNESPEVTTAQIAMPEMRARGKRTVWIASLTLIFGIGIGHAATLIKDAYFPSKLEEVLVLATHADGSHPVTDKYGREFSVKWCSGPDDLVPGNKLPAVYYRQQLGCKQIRGMFLGYSVYSYKDGTRMIFPIPKENAYAR